MTSFMSPFGRTEKDLERRFGFVRTVLALFYEVVYPGLAYLHLQLVWHGRS